MGFNLGNSINAVKDPYAQRCLMLLARQVASSSGTLSTVVQNGAPSSTPSILSGSGTANRLTRWTGTLTQGNSLITDNGTDITIVPPGTALLSGGVFEMSGGTVTIGAGSGLSGIADGEDIVVASGVGIGGGGNGIIYLQSGGGLPAIEIGSLDIRFTASVAGRYLFYNPTDTSFLGELDFDNLTSSARKYTFQDGSGTLAFTSDITAAIGAVLSDTAYDATTWDGVTTVAPTKNALRDKIETLWTLDGTTQTLTASKTINLTGSSGFFPKFKRTVSSGTTDACMEFQTSGGIKVLSLGYGAMGGPSGRPWIVWDSTAGTSERASVTRVGVVSGSDSAGANFAALCHPNVATAWTANNTHSGTETFNALTTFNTGATFNTSAPLFNNVSPIFATTANGVYQGLIWPTGGAGTANIRAGVKPTLFTATLDNIYDVSYNLNHATGARDDSGAHSFTMQTEFDFYNSGDSTHSVEHFYSFGPSGGGTEWRPQFFGIDIASETAHWFWRTSITNDTTPVYAMEVNGVTVFFGRDSAIHSFGADASMGSYQYMRDYSASAGTSTYGTKNVLLFDSDAVDMSNTIQYGHAIQLDLTPTTGTTGYVVGYGVPTPAGPGASHTNQGLMGWYAQNLNFAAFTGFTAGYAQVFRADSQNCASGDQGNMVMAGVGYNTGHYQAGAWHLWDSNSGTLRAKASAPTSDGDGGQVIVVTSPTTYTASNVTTDRSYDANATTLDEVADVLGTLIADLRTQGLVL